MKNRQIKFRAWDCKDKIMWLPMSLEDLINGGWELETDNQEHSLPQKDYLMFAQPDTFWMQFTGLVDKNGKEIYECDIISYRNRVYEVCINFNGYYLQRYKLWNGKFKPAFHYALSLITKPFNKGERGENGGIVNEAEVIGNRYENPEFVNQMKNDALTG